jgi:Transposase DDE domain
MHTNLIIALDFLEKCWQKNPRIKGKGANPTYSIGSMVIFLVLMMVKKIYAFKSMEKYAKNHYQAFGWQKAPSRKTIRRRFLALPSILQILMPQIAKECDTLNHNIFGFSWAFVDKSIFRAMGGIWHKQHIKLGIVPHSSIDTDASWGFSPYHRWRFGYGLHLVANQNRFPIIATVTTAKAKDYSQITLLLTDVCSKIGVLVGDAGYFSVRIMQKVYQTSKVFLYTHKTFVKAKTTFKKHYNQMVDTVYAQLLYKKRKPSIEPVFSIIKEIYDLNGETPLPYKKIEKVTPFLMLTVISVQLMMYVNFKNRLELGNTNTIFSLF